MQLRFGTYFFPVNGVMVDVRTAPILTMGVRSGRRATFRVSGFLEGSSQLELSALSLLLDTALAVPYQDLVLLMDSGAASHTAISSSQSVTGVVVTDGPNYPGGEGEYATVRRFNFEATAEYFDPSAVNAVTAFRETLEFRGGGPLIVALPALVGEPQMQKVYERTPCRVTQKGSATGLLRYPDPIPQPIFPGYENEEARFIGYTGPDRNAKLFRDYTVSWQYEFISSSPLVGLPNFWLPGGI